MKVLQINNVYNRLSTGKIVADLHKSYIQKGIESFVAYARGPLVVEPNVSKFNWEFYAHVNKIRGRMTGLLYGGNFVSTNRLFRIIKAINPEIIHLHCINDDSVNIYQLLSFLKKYSCKTVITLHAEFFHTGNCGNSYECDKWKTGCFNCSQLKQLHTLFDNTKCAWNLMAKSFYGFNPENLITCNRTH